LYRRCTVFTSENLIREIEENSHYISLPIFLGFENFKVLPSLAISFLAVFPNAHGTDYASYKKENRFLITEEPQNCANWTYTLMSPKLFVTIIDSSSVKPETFFVFFCIYRFFCQVQFHAGANAVITDAVNVYCNEEEPADVGRIALPRPGRA
jgi:hypothetical protein